MGVIRRRAARTCDVIRQPVVALSPSPKQEVERGEEAECPSPVPNAFAISHNNQSKIARSDRDLARSK